MFKRKYFNGQIIDRPWLIYSETTGKVFCERCRLFQENNKDSYLESERFFILFNNPQQHRPLGVKNVYEYTII